MARIAKASGWLTAQFTSGRRSAAVKYEILFFTAYKSAACRGSCSKKPVNCVSLLTASMFGPQGLIEIACSKS